MVTSDGADIARILAAQRTTAGDACDTVRRPGRGLEQKGHRRMPKYTHVPDNPVSAVTYGD